MANPLSLLKSAWEWAGRRFRSLASGTPLPRTQVRVALDGTLDAATAEARALAEKLALGAVDRAEWLKAMKRLTKDAVVACGTVAAGGRANHTPATLGALGARVAFQYRYLDSFAREVDAGLPLDARFLARCQLYPLAGTAAYEAALRKGDADAGYDLERRVIGGPNPCAGCRAEAAKGWSPIGTLKAIGSCECLNRCRCQFATKKSGDAEFAMIDHADSPVLFSAVVPVSGRRTEDGWNVYPDAVLFEVGDYPDKSFFMTREEARRAVESFRGPVGGNIEHTRFMKGRACQVRSMRIDPAEPDVIRGEVALPATFDAHLIDEERRLSCEWDHATKRLSGLALTLNPRVKRAALLAAFSAGEASPEDVALLESDPDPAEFATPRKLAEGSGQHWQAIHDAAAQYDPALCGAAVGSTPPPSGPAAMGDRTAEHKSMRRAHADAVTHGANCPGSEVARMSGDRNPTGESPMDLVKFREAVGALPDDAAPDQIRAALALAPADALASFAKAVPAPEPEPESPAMREMRLKLERIEARNEADRLARVEEDAARFAVEQFEAGKVLRKAAGNLVALFKQAAHDDHAHAAAVAFSADSGAARGSRLDALRAFFADVTPHGLFDSSLANRDLAVLFHKSGTAPADDGQVSDEEFERNLNYTESGRAILASRAASKKGA